MLERFATSRPRSDLRVRADETGAARRLAEQLCRLCMAARGSLDAGPGTARQGPQPPTVVLCIGTDRSTGDALGPLVGSRLVEAAVPWDVRGTIDEPVHASNLEQALADLAVARPRPLVLAVDACLGRLENVGTISVSRGPLQPGAGVNKTLPAIGDVALTGTVNVGGFMEYLILQNTRLSVVMSLARVMSDALVLAAARLALPIARLRDAAGDSLASPEQVAATAPDA